ncbi:TPA: mechanosensitive ion channel [Candidatus Woesearchaeota archaeon]|nr:mechanosensitive ion channel [Candidatus Woesearchaeota archaeon]
MVVSFLQVLQSYFWIFVGGVVILLIGFTVGILLRKLGERLLHEIGLNAILIKIGINSNAEKVIPSIFAYATYILTIIFVLDIVGIKPTVPFYIIVGAILALFILTIMVSVKDILPNFIGWIFIQKKGKIKIGQTIDVREITGVVENIGYLETEIRTDKGDLLYIPNSLFLKSKYLLKNR